jgi:catechol 2,3-dioxygenase-like lactoylglutathione lyase family enzyme
VDAEAPRAIHHVALRVADLPRALAFYGGVLRLVEVRRFHEDGALRSIWLKAGPAVVMLERSLKGRGPAEGSGHVLALAVDALGPWEQRLREAGIPVDDRTESTLFVSDPDGHRVGLSVYPLRFDA